MLLADAAQEWLLALEAEGRRPDTLDSYRSHLTVVLRSLDAQKASSLTDLSPFHIRRWLVDYQRTHAPYSTRSVFISLRAFLRWCQREGLLDTNPLASVKPPKYPEIVKDTYSSGQMRATFAALTADRSPLGLRDSAILAVLADTGLRATEVCHLTLSDLASDSLMVRRTKTGKVRPAFLGKRSGQLLARYLSLGRPKLHPKGDWLFVSRDGQQLNRNTIRLLLRRLSEKLGFRLNAHKFRHTWATALARSGASAQSLQALAGWSTGRMAERYVHLAASDLREAHAKAKPLDGVG